LRAQATVNERAIAEQQCGRHLVPCFDRADLDEAIDWASLMPTACAGADGCVDPSAQTCAKRSASARACRSVPWVSCAQPSRAYFRLESGRILAALIRESSSFDVGEDALQDAFNAGAMTPVSNYDPFNASAVSLWLLLIPAATLLLACGTAREPALPADSRVILEAHLSHGIGDSPFDSPLVHDSVAAGMIVRAHKCAPRELLRRLADDTAHGGRLLEQLRSAGVLVLRDDKACTTFPILVGEEQRAYAKLTGDVAQEARNVLSSEFATLLRMVDKRGWREWQYHFLWSQLFDSQFAWTEMMQRKIVPPLSHLIAWAIYPDHPFRSGTNYYPDNELRDHWLMVSWRANGANTVALVGGAWETIYGLAADRSAMSNEDQAKLAELELVDDRGRLIIPILENGDPLLDHLRLLAVRYVALLEQQVPLDSLMALTGVDRQYTFAIAYHDISWDIVAEFVRGGLVEAPPALKPAARHASSSMRGVAAITPAYPPFVELIRTAIGAR
jgi:hypothetical protein